MDTSDEIEELSKPLYDERLLVEDKIFVAKKLRISLDELTDLIEQPAHHYSEYPNHQKKLKILRLGYAFLTKKIYSLLRK
jgi:hypothetical protein